MLSFTCKTQDAVYFIESENKQVNTKSFEEQLWAGF